MTELMEEGMDKWLVKVRWIHFCCPKVMIVLQTYICLQSAQEVLHPPTCQCCWNQMATASPGANSWAIFIWKQIKSMTGIILSPFHIGLCVCVCAFCVCVFVCFSRI